MSAYRYRQFSGLVLVVAAFGAALIACDNSPQNPVASKDAVGAKVPTSSAAAKEGQPAAAAKPVLADCPGEGAHDDGSCQHAPPSATDQHHFGAAFRLDKGQPLKVAASHGGGKARTVRVNGTVASVCQKSGCWMVLQDGDTRARVFTKQKKFFLPITIAGKKASVEGKLQAHTISEKLAKHLESDRGGDPSQVKGPSDELVIYATAVELL